MASLYRPLRVCTRYHPRVPRPRVGITCDLADSPNGERAFSYRTYARAVIEAGNNFGRFFTGQVTAAGKLDPAKVLVIGAGVAGLQAIASSKRLGAQVEGYDIRPAVKEQVDSFLAAIPAEGDDWRLTAAYAGYNLLNNREKKAEIRELIDDGTLSRGHAKALLGLEGLDPITSDAINRMIQRLDAELGVTSIVVTHDMGTAFAVSDRIAMVHRGQIIKVGTPDEFRDPEDPRVADFIHGHEWLADISAVAAATPSAIARLVRK